MAGIYGSVVSDPDPLVHTYSVLMSQNPIVYCVFIETRYKTLRADQFSFTMTLLLPLPVSN